MKAIPERCSSLARRMGVLQSYTVRLPAIGLDNDGLIRGNAVLVSRSRGISVVKGASRR